VIYVTSVEAHRAVPNRAVYGAMKAGVTNLAKTLALELAADGIRVNTIAPDIFPTPATAMPGLRLSDEELALQERLTVPMERFGSGEDLSGGVIFLASDLASYVTGTTLHVDGGTYASSGWFNWPGEGYVNTVPQPTLDFLIGDTG
jgi:NAD(P)-dependent dehydrogenase (short-subunit alcohol dehydrogenase family)